MKRLTRFQENISVKKATNYAIIINSLEILLILGVMTLVVISPQYDFSPRMMRLLVGVAAAVIIWGAVMDIREAMSTRRLLSQLDAMDDTIDAMEKLNNTLRAQRHDFLEPPAGGVQLDGNGGVWRGEQLHREGLRAHHGCQPRAENRQRAD